MVAGRARPALARWLAPLAIACACMTLARCAPAERLQLQWLDASFRLLRQVTPEAARAEVAIVGVDQASIDASGKPFALMLDEFALGLDGLRRGGAAGVGVDLVFPAASFAQLVPGGAQRLALAIGRLRAAAPLVLGHAGAGSPRGDAAGLYAAMAGAGGLGLLLVPADRDGVLRRIGSAELRSDLLLAPRLAASLGQQAEPGIVDFSIGAPFGYVPLHTVVALARAGDDAALRRHFAGKLVLLGAILPDQDRQRLPLGLAAWEAGTGSAGVVFQAQALRSLMQGRMVSAQPWVADCAALLALFVLWHWRLRPRRACAAAVLMGGGVLGASVCLLAAGVFAPVAAPLLSLACAMALLGVQAYRRELAERQRMRAIFSGYVSPAILDTILSGALKDGLAGKRQQLAFLFADIRGFTAFCAATAPEEVIAFLNRYYTVISAALHRHDGTIDKFSGDGIMVFFGAPQASANPARDAILAALDMLDALAGLNRELAREGSAPIRVGIGIAHGDAVLGNVGSAQRHDYTATGAATTLAAHIQQYSKQVPHTLLVDDAAFVLADLPPAQRDRFRRIEANIEKHGSVVLAAYQETEEDHA
ncbi:CHASE2 domain-containing protein [Massilia brevitalea]|uniref:CHASE2 domain-containing protein n=1 Tax=Massilia brevitalea TaxID=442526 RepID=UPI00273895A3|nr:adenylate/guanylate cyclase domain-containing protein [Massilia brevitalea]